MARKNKPVRRDKREGGAGEGGAAGRMPEMINASRAFRNLPPELVVGKEYLDEKD